MTGLSNYAMNPTVRPVTRLAVMAPPYGSSKGGGQGERSSRPAGDRGCYADKVLREWDATNGSLQADA